MKKLQNNFTTLDQSKRLMELGVPAWTADLYFYEEGCISNDDEPSGVIPYDEVYEDNSKETMFSSYVELPCWSVGRLLEIYLICNEVIDNVTELHHSAIKVDVREFNIVEYMIRKLSNKVKKNKSFFSKLEE